MPYCASTVLQVMPGGISVQRRQKGVVPDCVGPGGGTGPEAGVFGIEAVEDAVESEEPLTLEGI